MNAFLMLTALLSMPLDTTVVYPQMETAVQEAFKLIPADAQGEMGGGILFCDNANFKGYVLTEAVGQGDSHKMQMQIVAPKDWNCRTVALYHTHPGTNEAADYFSTKDIEVAEQLNIPSFIRTSLCQCIKAFYPGKTHKARARIGLTKDSRIVSAGEKL